MLTYDMCHEHNGQPIWHLPAHTEVFSIKATWLIWYGNTSTTQCFPVCKKATSKLDKRKTIHTLTQKIFFFFPFLPLLGKYFCWFLTLKLDHLYEGYCRNADSCMDNPAGTWLCSMVLHYAWRLKLYRGTAANQIWTPHGQPLAQEETPTSSFALHVSPRRPSASIAC